MPVLAPNQPITLDTPELLVQNRLPSGRHRFSLSVRNARGVESEPTVVIVTVTERLGPVIGTPGIGTPVIGTPVIGTPVSPTPVITTPVLTPTVPRPPGRRPRRNTPR